MIFLSSIWTQTIWQHFNKINISDSYCNCCATIPSTNVTIKWLELVLLFWMPQAPGFCKKTSYPDVLLWLFSIPSGKCWDSTLKYTTTFFHILPNLLFAMNIPFCIVWCADNEGLEQLSLVCPCKQKHQTMWELCLYCCTFYNCHLILHNCTLRNSILN